LPSTGAVAITRRFNGRQAARAAGYSEKRLDVEPSELLKHPEIAALIKERLAETAMGAHEVQQRLAEIARGEYADFIETDPSGYIVRFDFAAAKKAGKLHLVKKFEATEGGYKVEYHDPLKALQMLGKAHGLFTDKVEQSGSIEIKLTYDDDQPNPT